MRFPMLCVTVTGIVMVCLWLARETTRWLSFFFFQAEDGIRDYKVTGVQTCALPISACLEMRPELVDERSERQSRAGFARLIEADAHVLPHPLGGEAEAFGLQLVHLLPPVLHLPGLRGALGDHADHFLDLELVPFAEGDRLGN